MRSQDPHRLRDELRLAGAEPAEIPELLSLASRLERLSVSPLAGVDMPTPKTRTVSWLKPLDIGAAGLAAGLLLIAASQSVLPTSWLFPVQKATDSAAMAIHPQYRATVMMKRADQIHALVVGHANDQRILAALADYGAVVRSYKAVPHTDYAAFQYCESTLKQAAREATPQVNQAIQASLESLDTT